MRATQQVKENFMLDLLIDTTATQHWINVYRKNTLVSDGKAINFTYREKDGDFARIFVLDGEFVRVETYPQERAVVSVAKVEYLPYTQMAWIPTAEQRHWSTAPRMYKHYKGGVYKVIGEGRHTETDEELIYYQRADCECKDVWARPKKMFLDHLPCGTPRFRLIREALAKK